MKETNKALIGALPAGSVLALAFDKVLGPHIEQRRQEWREDIIGALEQLQREFKDFKWQTSINNQMFVSTFMQSLLTVSKDHRKEKRELLRNALLNTALGRTPSEDLQFLFLDMIDRLSPLHISVLKTFSKDISTTVPIEELLTKEIKALNGDKDLALKLLTDLKQESLLKDHLEGRVLGTPGYSSFKSTKLTQRFLDFISAPAPEKK